MKLVFSLFLLVLTLLWSCTSGTDNAHQQENRSEEIPEFVFTEEEKQFSNQHYAIAVTAIKAIQHQQFDSLENLVANEFLPPQGFDSLEFIRNISTYLRDKNLPQATSVKMSFGTNPYQGSPIPFKTYDFPIFQTENEDTTGQSTVVITFADKIEKNKIVNISFRDY